MSKFTYEESVRWLRSQPELAEFVEQCYLDEDNLAAAKRFAASEEFAAVAAFLKANRPHPKLKILDLGCGNGIASYAFASLGHEVSSVDPDPSEDVGLGATSRLAEAAGAGSIATFASYAESLPFPDSAFDAVYARQSLHHFGDLTKGLSECARVLKPTGLFLATREHVVSDREQLEAFFAEHPLHRMHGGENAYPVEEYLAALEQAGFRVLKCLAPFDTVINHYPSSNEYIRSQFFQGLEKKLGTFIASVVAEVPPAEKWYRNRLSRFCNDPGRLYSFLCAKK